MEKKVETLAELKAERVTLRNKAESGDTNMDTLVKYVKATRKVKELESWLLWTIVSLILILAIGGCISNTLDGMRQDIHNASAPGAQASWTK